MKSLILCLALLLAALALSSPARSQHTREVKKTIPLAADGTLTIDTYKGSIHIETWDKPEVDMTATIEPDGHSRDDYDRVEDTEIKVSGSSDRVNITSDYDRVKSHRSWFFGLFGDDGPLPFVQYDIRMPSTAHLRIKDYKSDTRISGLAAPIEMETYKGTLEMRDITGSIDLDTYKGEARIYYAKYAGTNRMKTYKGRIDLRLPADASFDLDTDFGRRADLDTDFDHIERTARHGEVRYRGTVNGGANSLHLESEKGQFSVLKR